MSELKDELKVVWKECGRTNTPCVANIIRTYDAPKKILIVFWHGVGDLLMFYPVYLLLKHMFMEHSFDLGLLPGVGHKELFPDGKELPEKDFVKDHDVAFVLSFHMVEGSSGLTKAEYCLKNEIGDLNGAEYLCGLPSFKPCQNRLVGVHFQGTCLPGSTNPDEALAHQIWDDIKAAGYVPLDLHQEHVFHNPQNKPFPWVSRGCRDLPASLQSLRMLIERCAAVVAVASGPFVLSMCINQQNTIYLQKHHKIGCYIRGFTNIIDLLAYDGKNLIQMLNRICERNADG